MFFYCGDLKRTVACITNTFIIQFANEKMFIKNIFIDFVA